MMKLLKVALCCGQLLKMPLLHRFALLIGMGLLYRAMAGQIVDKSGQTYSQPLIHIPSRGILRG
ncbi:hypothetical protein HA051_05100 [Chromobacterium vaccinii]|nr:hypothetical protein [Chromobacterium vaccinii]MBX9356646.1 hypothetical protein [Chromobacterium vaccinii]NHQ80955.1 hypothetical protein [Chromobacterium vaccinii]